MDSGAVPVIPPNNLSSATSAGNSLPPDPDELPSWFIVQSPREIKGVSGPYSVPDLKEMHKSGEIKDSTLMWQQGQKNWEQLLYQRFLRPKILQLPIIPPRLGHFDEKRGIFDPVLGVPTSQQLKESKPLAEYHMTKWCSRCGGVAISHLPTIGEQIPDLMLLRNEVGTTKVASEIIAGFLWIGNVGSSKLAPMNSLGITLAVNCTANMKSIPDKAPHFRSKTALLKESPTSKKPKNMKKLLDIFSKAHDWIEVERLYPEYGLKSYPVAPEYKGPTDKFGRPVRSDEPQMRKKQLHEKQAPGRVLLWSKQGFERSCAIGAAYLIKHYGLTVERAVNVIESARPGTKISLYYYSALVEWGRVHTLGDLLCTDCMAISVLEGEGKEGDREVLLEEVYGEFSELCSSDTQLLSLGDAFHYMPMLLTSVDMLSPWCGLLDLQVAGRSLGDAGASSLFKNLAQASLALQLRVINISSNNMGFVGLTGLLDALMPLEKDDEGEEGEDCSIVVYELMVLDVSHNIIDEDGAVGLAALLKQCNSITTLDISHNRLGDEGAVALFGIFNRPSVGFYDPSERADDSSSLSRGAESHPPHNFSLTALDISCNSLSHDSADVLVEMLKHNYSITSLNIGFNVDLDAKDLKHVMNSLRVYNTTVECLSFADMPVTVKTMGYIARVVEGQGCCLRSLDIARCDLTAPHMTALTQHMPAAKLLCSLDLSGNKILGEGGVLLAKGLSGKVDKLGVRYPRLQRLDVSNCFLDPAGCQAIICAIAENPTVKYLDMSGNNMNDLVHEYADNLKICLFEELRLSQCQLKAKGATAIFDILRYATPNTLSVTLRRLMMADNDIHDSAAMTVADCLQRNNTLSMIDLGFNNFTSHSDQCFASATKISSQSSAQRKLLELSVNMVGNKCDPYVLEMPNMARSKNTFSRGLAPTKLDPYNSGKSHVPKLTREHFAIRVEANDSYELMKPRFAMNNLS